MQWNNAIKWSVDSNGPPMGGVPPSPHTVIFDGAGSSNGNATLTGTVSVSSITINGYSGTLNFNGYAVSIASALTHASGTLKLSTSNVSVGGDFIKAGASTFDAGLSTITFNGSANATLRPGATNFYTMVVNKTGNSSVTLGGALNVTNTFNVTGGTLTTSGSNYSIDVASVVNINGGSLNLNASTMGVIECRRLPLKTRASSNSPRAARSG